MIYLMLAWFLAYPLAIYLWQGRILSSISASSYLLKGTKKAWFAGWLVGLGLLSYWLDMGLYSHVMALGFAITGMSPEHKRNPRSAEDEFHTVGTIVAVAAGFVGLWDTYGMWEATAAFIPIALVLWLWAENRIWWIEILAGLCIFGGYVAL